MSIVILVSVDGVRPDAFSAAACSNFTAFMRRSAYTLQATSVMPSITLPCHTSIFHSVPPSRHGITSNTWTPMARPVPGLIDLAARQGLRCASFIGWEQLRDISRPGSLILSFNLNTAESDLNTDKIIAEEAIRHLDRDTTIDFAFVYFGTVDTVGHNHGWMSPQYLAQVEQVDAVFGQFVQALPSDATILVQSDHGGHDRNHGTDTPEDMTIPWLIAGPGIRQNHAITVPVSLLDTAPTLAKVLNIVPAPQWEGICVEEVFC